MINYILKVDYALSVWFSKRKDIVKPGTSYLFLIKVAFVLCSVLNISYKLLFYEIEIEFFVGGLMLAILIVMYSFQKPLEEFVEKRKLKTEYLKLKNSEVLKRRGISLLIFGLFFLCQFLAVFI